MHGNVLLFKSKIHLVFNNSVFIKTFWLITCKGKKFQSRVKSISLLFSFTFHCFHYNFHNLKNSPKSYIKRYDYEKFTIYGMQNLLKIPDIPFSVIHIFALLITR